MTKIQLRYSVNKNVREDFNDFIRTVSVNKKGTHGIIIEKLMKYFLAINGNSKYVEHDDLEKLIICKLNNEVK